MNDPTIPCVSQPPTRPEFNMIDFTKPCQCTVEGFCPHYGRKVVGRDWIISRMVNEMGNRFRKRWLDQLKYAQELFGRKECGCRKVKK